MQLLILMYQKKLNFKDLKLLDLRNNRITDIKVLGKAKFKNLLFLLLNDNKLSDIKALKNKKFKGIKNVYFEKNEIPHNNPLLIFRSKSLEN